MKDSTFSTLWWSSVTVAAAAIFMGFQAIRGEPVERTPISPEARQIMKNEVGGSMIVFSTLFATHEAAKGQTEATREKPRPANTPK